MHFELYPINWMTNHCKLWSEQSQRKSCVSWFFEMQGVPCFCWAGHIHKWQLNTSCSHYYY